MKHRKGSILIFLISLSLCLFLAVITIYSVDIRSKFHQKSIPYPMLAYGETGKILRELGSIQPLENKDSVEGFVPNIVEFAQRAAKERKKWLLLDKFKKYADKGVFGYIEMQTKEPLVPFNIFSKGENEWVRNVNSRIKPNKIIYPFFLDLDDPEIYIRLILYNKKHPVTIKGMAFFLKGSHPLVYTDPIAFNRFQQEGDKDYFKTTPYGINVLPSDSSRLLQGKLSFKKKRIAGISKYHKKQGNTQIDLVSKANHPLLKNLKIKKDELAKISENQISVLSIDVDEVDLHSKQHGILTNFDEHGRQWERLSYVRFYRNGRDVFSNFSGIRLQGGDPGRKEGLINFRLFFREEYGKSKIESRKLFEGAVGDIKRLAVKQSEWPKWPLNSPIAYDVSRQIGALAPPTELVLLYLNGKNL
ncbi:MAG: hypothetical protein KJO32_17260, partial [Deltaproteobacteria bacterium]|nr:hypothetical protein [Deltaproteobacteria bacterium]